MKYICSLVTVTDMKRSRYFYETLLNQKIKYDFGESVTFYGDFTLHLASHYKRLIDNRPIRLGGNNVELYFEDDNIEQVVEQMQSHNVTFVHELREQPWKQRVVRFYDPDNYIVEVGESLEYLILRLYNQGNSPAQIVDVTGISSDIVSATLQTYGRG